MRHIDWQFVIVALALTGAAAYLVRRALAALRSKESRPAGCSSCSACPSSQVRNGRSPEFVHLELPVLSRHEGRAGNSE